MPNILNPPTCLHVPPLQSGKAATLLWSKVPGADGYQLDCIYDHAFKSLGVGKDWLTLQERNTLWSDVSDILTWQQCETEPTQDPLTLYRGPGVEKNDPAYEPGVTHIAHEISVPPDITTACYRVRAYAADTYSSYITSDVLTPTSLADGPDLDCSMSFPFVNGEEYFLQFSGKDSIGQINNIMLLKYPETSLQLVDTFYIGGGTTNKIIEVLNNSPGLFKFRYRKYGLSNQEWEGLIIGVQFRAKKTGMAAISLLHE